MHKNSKLILLIGAPSTGKTSTLEELSKAGYTCFEEISRDILQEARTKGISHLFQKQPLLFSDMLLEKRKQQYYQAKKMNTNYVFIDRGLPDITAYLDMINTDYPDKFIKANEELQYDMVFWFPLWEEIYTSDRERYEDYKIAASIQQHLIKSYKSYNYQLIEVPKLSVTERADFILSYLKNT